MNKYKSKILTNYDESASDLLGTNDGSLVIKLLKLELEAQRQFSHELNGNYLEVIKKYNDDIERYQKRIEKLSTDVNELTIDLDLALQRENQRRNDTQKYEDTIDELTQQMKELKANIYQNNSDDITGFNKIECGIDSIHLKTQETNTMIKEFCKNFGDSGIESSLKKIVNKINEINSKMSGKDDSETDYDKELNCLKHEMKELKIKEENDIENERKINDMERSSMLALIKSLKDQIKELRQKETDDKRDIDNKLKNMDEKNEYNGRYILNSMQEMMQHLYEHLVMYDEKDNKCLFTGNDNVTMDDLKQNVDYIEQLINKLNDMYKAKNRENEALNDSHDNGACIKYETRINELKLQVNRLLRKNKELSIENDELNGDIEHLQNELHDFRTKTREIKNKIHNKYDEMSKQFNTLQESVTNKDNEIIQLKDELKESHQQFFKLLQVSPKQSNNIYHKTSFNFAE